MARYRGPSTKIARKFGEEIFGYDKYFQRRKYAPGQHGQSRKRKTQSEYAIQLREKQKAKYTYGLLERQFYKTFEKALSKHGVTGEVLLQLLEARLDNTVFRLGFAATSKCQIEQDDNNLRVWDLSGPRATALQKPRPRTSDRR